MKEIIELAKLIKKHNKIDNEISALIGRPALIGHTGEFIASKVFDISLAVSASQKSIDGFFQSGPLKNQSVNIKWYTYDARELDITPNSLPDYYLVLTGGQAQPSSSRGRVRPWVIEKVYLFEAKILVENLSKMGKKIGIPTSIDKVQWSKGEIYPKQANTTLPVGNEQKRLLSLFLPDK
jgi:hypothetical protein